jgi:hypothetical protein
MLALRGETMDALDSPVLRRLAADYRERAKTETNPKQARILAEIAEEMEADAAKREQR